MTDIEMLLFWAYEAWAALDHNEHENIASNLFKYIELVQGGLTPLAPDAASLPAGDESGESRGAGKANR